MEKRVLPKTFGEFSPKFHVFMKVYAYRLIYMGRSLMMDI